MPAQTVKHYAVLLRELPKEDLSSLDPPSKYSTLKDHAKAAAETIKVDIKAAGLQDELTDIAPPTAFNTLFIDATETVAKRVAKLPIVTRISELPQTSVDLD